MHENKEAVDSTQLNPVLPIARQKLLQYLKIHLEMEFVVFQNFMYLSHDFPWNPY